MNTVILCGRLVRDPEIRQGNTEVATYTLAVDRRTRDKETDFISCVAFGKTAEFVEKYLTKGTKILIRGRIQVSNYTGKDGKKAYSTNIIVDEHEFVESKGTSQKAQTETNSEEFMKIPDNVTDESLPFN